MSEACAIFAEVVVTTGKALGPGQATMIAVQANATTCFYAPQTCAAMPATLAAGGMIDSWAQLVQYSPAFEELNKLAFEKGCRLVLSPVDESRRTWRVIVVTVDDVGKTARQVVEEAEREIDGAARKSRAWYEFLNTPDGIRFLMDRLR